MSLRELLQQIERRDKVLGLALRALLETVAEMHAKEKAEIERLRSERDERALLAVGSEMSLADARKTRDCLCEELVEAKANVARLVGLLDNATTAAAEWMRQCHDPENRLDAEIGKMVRAMGDNSRLIKAGGAYRSQQYDSAGDLFRCSGVTFDPKVALAAIQEVGDAKA